MVVALAGAGADVVGRSSELGTPGGGGGEGGSAGVPGGGDATGGGDGRTPSAGQTTAHCACSAVLLAVATLVMTPVCDTSTRQVKRHAAAAVISSSAGLTSCRSRMHRTSGSRHDTSSHAAACIQRQVWSMQRTASTQGHHGASLQTRAVTCQLDMGAPCGS